MRTLTAVRHLLGLPFLGRMPVPLFSVARILDEICNELQGELGGET